MLHDWSFSGYYCCIWMFAKWSTMFIFTCLRGSLTALCFTLVKLKHDLFLLRIFLWSSTLVNVLQSMDLWSLLLQYTQGFCFQLSRLFWLRLSLIFGLVFYLSSKGFISAHSLNAPLLISKLPFLNNRHLF